VRFSLKFLISVRIIACMSRDATPRLGIAALVRPEVAAPYVAMIFGPLLILLRTTADQQTLRAELMSGSEKQVAEALHHTSNEASGSGSGGARGDGGGGGGGGGGDWGGGGGGGGGGATVQVATGTPVQAAPGPVTESYDPQPLQARPGPVTEAVGSARRDRPQLQGEGGGEGAGGAPPAGGVSSPPRQPATTSPAPTGGGGVTASSVVDAFAGQSALRRALGMRIQDERLSALSAGTDESSQVEKLAWCRSQMTRVNKEHSSAVASLRVESKRLAECQSKLTVYAQRRRVAAFAEPADLMRVVAGDRGGGGGGAAAMNLAAAVQGAATEQSQLAAAAALGGAGALAKGVSHLSPEEAAPLRSLARDTLDQSYRHAILEIDHPAVGNAPSGAHDASSSGSGGAAAADDMQARMAALAQQIALGAAVGPRYKLNAVCCPIVA
jgi:hypothetical protein